jgi:hypothetical protein
MQPGTSAKAQPHLDALELVIKRRRWPAWGLWAPGPILRGLWAPGPVTRLASTP